MKNVYKTSVGVILLLVLAFVFVSLRPVQAADNDFSNGITVDSDLDTADDVLDEALLAGINNVAEAAYPIPVDEPSLIAVNNGSGDAGKDDSLLAQTGTLLMNNLPLITIVAVLATIAAMRYGHKNSTYLGTRY